MKGFRHIEFFGSAPDSTGVPAGISSEDCDQHHTSTIGARSGSCQICKASLFAKGKVNLKPESPRKGSIL